MRKEYPIPEIVNMKNVILMAKKAGYDPERIMPPTRKNSKLSYLTPDGRRINFGNKHYPSYDRHMDIDRRERYLQRAKGIRGGWYNDPYSPNSLSINLLWNPCLKLS